MRSMRGGGDGTAMQLTNSNSGSSTWGGGRNGGSNGGVFAPRVAARKVVLAVSLADALSGGDATLAAGEPGAAVAAEPRAPGIREQHSDRPDPRLLDAALRGCSAAAADLRVCSACSACGACGGAAAVHRACSAALRAVGTAAAACLRARARASS